MRSDGSRHEKSSTTLDPMLCRGLAKFEENHHHVGIALDGTLTNWIVVAGALVDVLRRLDALLNWLHVDDRHLDEQLHDLRLTEYALFFIPVSALKEQAVDVGALFGSGDELSCLGLLRNEVEVESVDGRRVLLSGEALEKGRGEAGGEGERTDPEASGAAIGHPFSEELVTLAQVLLPVGERLKTEVGKVPLVGDNVG